MPKLGVYSERLGGTGTQEILSQLDLIQAEIDNISGGSGISAIVEDLTPQLGGDLDPNGNKFAGNIIPSANETYSLGVSGEQFSNVFSQEFNIDGNSLTVSGGELNLNGSPIIATASKRVNTTPFVITGDTFPDNYKLILHMDNIGLTDSSPSAHTITKSGDVTRSDTEAKFGGYSAFFDDTLDRLTLPLLNTQDFNFRTGDFTIHFWFKPSSTENYDILLSASEPNVAYYWYFGMGWAGKIGFYTEDGGDMEYTRTLTNGVWYHMCVERYGNTITLYEDGVSKATADVTSVDVNATYNANSLLAIGAFGDGQQAAHGYVDELIISKGVALFQGAFTPPIAALAPSIPPATTVIDWDNFDYCFVNMLADGEINMSALETNYMRELYMKISNVDSTLSFTNYTSGAPIYTENGTSIADPISGSNLISFVWNGTGYDVVNEKINITAV